MSNGVLRERKTHNLMLEQLWLFHIRHFGLCVFVCAALTVFKWVGLV